MLRWKQIAIWQGRNGFVIVNEENGNNRYEVNVFDRRRFRGANHRTLYAIYDQAMHYARLAQNELGLGDATDKALGYENHGAASGDAAFSPS